MGMVPNPGTLVNIKIDGELDVYPDDIIGYYSSTHVQWLTSYRTSLHQDVIRYRQQETWGWKPIRLRAGVLEPNEVS